MRNADPDRYTNPLADDELRSIYARVLHSERAGGALIVGMSVDVVRSMCEEILLCRRLPIHLQSEAALPPPQPDDIRINWVKRGPTGCLLSTLALLLSPFAVLALGALIETAYNCLHHL